MIWFLATIVALLPTYLIRFNILSLPSTLLEVLVGVFLIGTVVRLRATGFRKIKSLGQINYAILLFVLAGIISTIISPDKRMALGQLKAFIIEPVLMFYAIILTVKSREQFNLVLKFLFWSAVVISAFGIFQYGSFIHLPLRFWGNGTEVERIVSVFDYPNALALYLAPLIGFYFALLANKYELFKNKYLLPIGLAIMTWALVLTFSRGAWLALALGVLIILAKRFGLKKILLPTVAAGILLLLVPSISHRLSLGLSDPSSFAHFDLFQAGINHILESPLLGMGLGGFTTLNLGVNYPHNIFLNFWLELGLLGLVSFGWIIYLALTRNKKSQPLVWAGIIYLLIFIVHGLVDVPYLKNDLALLFWLIIAIFYL